jgi:hypothetical protein
MTSDKLESDYQKFIAKAEQSAALGIEKVRSDLDALRDRAANYGGSA